MLAALTAALSQLGDKDSVSGAIVVSVFGLAIGFLSWAVTGLAKFFFGLFIRHRAKKAAYIQFYTAVRIRKENTAAVYGDSDRAAYLKSVRRGGSAFKGYVVAGAEEDAFALIRPFMPTMSARLMYLVKSYEGYDSLLDQQYLKIGTDDFRDLPLTRKLAVVEALYEAAGDVIKVCESVMKEMRKLRYIARLDAELKSLIKDLERHEVKEVGDGGQS